VDHVIAIVNSNDSSFDAPWADYITQKNIPVIGGQSYGLNWLKSPFFLSGGDVITQVEDEPLAAKQAGYKTYATVLCSEAAVCAQAIPLHEAGAKAAGITFAGGLLASATAANYTAQCLQLKDKGADIIANVVSTLRFKQDCDRQDYKPAWFLPASALTQQGATDLQDGIATVQSFPYFYTGPEAKDYHAAMATANIKPADDGMITSTSWVSGLMFEKAVKLSGATGVPTTADIFKGLNAFKAETLGGLSIPLTFGEPRPNGGRQLCYFNASFKAGKLLAPDGLKTACMAAS
jgi:branched-chain amino acid transport system substrate-binding protein